MATITLPHAVSRPTIKLKMKWIDPNLAKRTVVLPYPMCELAGRGFHQDLVDRAYAHLAYSRKFGGIENAEAVIALLAEGFVNPFDRARFVPCESDPSRELKLKALDAIEELATFYGDRVSSVVWDSLAHLACREDPEREKSIIKEASTGKLLYHYTLVDSALHAVGLVYTFALHANSVMFKHTGRILVHNCDCSCSLMNLELIGGSINYTMPQAKIQAATQSVFTHLCAETNKLMEQFLPFAYSITPEAREIQSLM